MAESLDEPRNKTDSDKAANKNQDLLVLYLLSSLYMSEGYTAGQEAWSAAMSILPGVTQTPARAQSKASIDKKVERLYLQNKPPWEKDTWQESKEYAAWLLSAMKHKLEAFEMSVATSVAGVKLLSAKSDRLAATTKG